jgi:nicotinate-nucleotide adenylyltransferase
VNTAPVTPLPFPPQARSILFCGGAFDPPHRAHVELADAARCRAAPEAWLLFVPAGRSPLKGASETPSQHRLEMLRLATAQLPQTGIWTDELDRDTPGARSYWIDTLRRARSCIDPQCELRFLIGADQAIDFHRWREPREILSIAQPLVLLRPPVTTVKDLRHQLSTQGVWSPDEVDRWTRCVVPLRLDPTSATEIRAKLARGEPHIPELYEPVLRYIRQHGLYH